MYRARALPALTTTVTRTSQITARPIRSFNASIAFETVNSNFIIGGQSSGQMPDAGGPPPG
jgi:hypothetical protein